MKTVGMIGGMSWESTAVYYRILNQEILKRTDGAHAARALLRSFDFGEMEREDILLWPAEGAFRP